VGFKVRNIIHHYFYLQWFQLPAVGFKDKIHNIHNICNYKFQLPAVGFKAVRKRTFSGTSHGFSFQQWDLKSKIFWYSAFKSAVSASSSGI